MILSKLSTLAPKATPECLAMFVDPDETLDAYGLHGLRLAHFLAQILHETAGLTVVIENMRYSAARIAAVWPSRFPTPESAATYANNPQSLANRVYGFRMGNTYPDDGWRYIGRGLLQITGRGKYASVGKKIGVKLVENPALALSPEHGLCVACEVWRSSGVMIYADADDLLGVTKRINGGTHGLESRALWLQKTKQALGIDGGPRRVNA